MNLPADINLFIFINCRYYRIPYVDIFTKKFLKYLLVIHRSKKHVSRPPEAAPPEAMTERVACHRLFLTDFITERTPLHERA
jgi:hypothetical protein